MYCCLLALLSTLLLGSTSSQDLPVGSVVPQNTTVLDGALVFFECVIPGTTWSFWQFNGNILTQSDNREISPSGLTIRKVNSSHDQGMYQCIGVVSNNLTYATPIAHLDVAYMEDAFVEQPKGGLIIEGNNTTLRCVGPEANPPINQITWYRIQSSHTVVLSPTSSVVYEDGGKRLVLVSISESDGGSYFCGVSNTFVARNSTKVIIFVSKVVVTVTLDNVTAAVERLYPLAGQDALLECRLHYSVKPPSRSPPVAARFSWNFKGSRLAASSTYVFPPNGSLIVRGVESSSAGDYSCTGSLEAWTGEASAVVHVIIAKIDSTVAVSLERSVVGREGEAELTCLPPKDAQPPPLLTWFKNGTEIGASQRHTLSATSDVLTISSLGLRDSGNYTCRAENVAGTVSANASLTVLDLPTVSVETVPVMEESNGVLRCASSSPNATNFIWYYHEDKLNASAKYGLSGNGDTLTVHNISQDDIGQYECEVFDSVHVQLRARAVLQFSNSLYIKNQPPDQTEWINGTVSFMCQFRSHFLNHWTVDWYHNNPKVQPGDRFKFSNTSKGDYTLTIHSLTVKDHGMYTCKGTLNNTVAGTLDEAHRSFSLITVVPIAFVRKPPTVVEVTVGQKVHIDCLTSGHPKPVVRWSRVNQPSAALQMLSNGTLVFASVHLNDSGQYSCSVAPSTSLETTVLYAASDLKVLSAVPEPLLAIDTIVIIVVGAIAILLYLVIFIICLCVCAKCYRNSLRRKKLELAAIENDPRDRKMSEAKDNSAILRHPGGTPMLNTGPANAPSSIYTVPRTPSPMESRRTETAFVDGLTPYFIPSPLPVAPTVVSQSTELPNFPRGNLKLGDRLGEGEFGPVLSGQAFSMMPDQRPMDVAIKVWLHPRDEDEETAEMDLLNFYSQMRLKFDNIACIIGMCTDVEPYYIIYEYMDRGDLKQFLLECRPDELDVPVLTQENLLHIVRQVANGMAYLSSQMIIHGDIAARNCLVSSDLRVKVADLGIGHDVYRDDYYDNGEQLLPVRWMPPEILGQPEFTLFSDIWSFGIFSWEVFAFGRLPYDDITDEEVLRLVPQGLRPEVPEEGCPVALYSLMRDCWSSHPESRPKFTQLVIAIIDLNLD